MNHTCIETKTTVDGSVPPPCAACLAENSVRAPERGASYQECLGLLRKLRHGGRIVSTAEIDATGIAIARAEDRMVVDGEGFGYVYLPPGMAVS